MLVAEQTGHFQPNARCLKWQVEPGEPLECALELTAGIQTIALGHGDVGRCQDGESSGRATLLLLRHRVKARFHRRGGVEIPVGQVGLDEQGQGGRHLDVAVTKEPGPALK